MENHTLTDRDYLIWLLMHQTMRVTHKALRKELRKHGITDAQFAVLLVIQNIGDKATLTEISNWLLLEHHSISSILTRMEKQGLVRKFRSLENKSRVNITITEKGQRAFNQSAKTESIREIMSCLSEEERQQLYSTLEKIRNNALKYVTKVNQPLFP